MKYKPTDLLTVYLDAAERLKVGRLAVRDRRILFEYDPAFIASEIQISPFFLPLKSGVAAGDPAIFDGLFGVFNDSLPDGWGRLLLDRAVEKYGIHRGQLTPLDRLAHVGPHGMGALVYEPDQTGDNEATIALQLDRIAAESATVLAGEQDDVVEKLFKLNGASSGARPKVVAQVSPDKEQISHGPMKLPAGYSHWIIKFPSTSDASDVGPVEYAYSLMAKDAGIVMPETFLFGSKKKRYFGVKRFDRDGDRRIHMHSLSGLINADHRIPSLDYDGFLKATLMLTRDVREVERAFSIACFNVLAHNRDDHAKNFSFLINTTGRWVLAPAYDLTFSYGPGGWQSTTVMGEGKTPRVADLRALAKKHSVAAAESMIARVQDAISRWPTHADAAGVTKKSASLVEQELRSTTQRDAPKATAEKSREKSPASPAKKSPAAPKSKAEKPKQKRK
jgi:serine/threonine-protein kinase HipA